MANISVANFTDLNTACQTSNTITVTAPITVTSTITVPAGVTVNLTGAQLSTSTAALRHFQLNGDLELSNITLDGGTTGGGIDMGNAQGTVSPTLTIDAGTVIQNCTAQKGGAVYGNQNAKITMNAGEINDNSAAEYGGGITCESGSTLDMTGGIVASNTAARGGGIYIGTGSTATLTGTSAPTSTLPTAPATGTPAIVNNTATQDGGDGGGIFNNSGTLSITNTLVQANDAANHGGGLFSNGGTINFTDSLISQNKVTINATTNGGGGIYLNSLTTTGLATCTLTNTTVDSNTSVRAGGGVYLQNSVLDLNNSTISNNVASLDGGGVFVGNSTNNVGQSSSLINAVGTNVITNNNALNGGGLFSDMGNIFSIANIHFVNNAASGNGGGIYLQGSAPTLTSVSTGPNTVFSGNRATNGGGYYVAP